MDQHTGTGHHVATAFVGTYRRALLTRDVEAIAAHYACPALIAFPGATVAVTDPGQTVAFFTSAVAQYDGVTVAAARVEVMGEGPGSLWLDVTWSYDGQAPPERFCYQLLETTGGWRIGVLTPLAPPAS